MTTIVRSIDPRQPKRDAVARAAETLGSHVFTERQSRSFTLSRPNKRDGGFDSNYAYSITWTPGSVFLAGDIGELTLTHYHAIWTFEDALRWLKTPDHEYLLGKSDQKEAFDADATVRFLLQAANEPVIEAMLGPTNWTDGRRFRVRKGGALWDAREWRKAKPLDAGEDYETLEEALADWQEDKPIERGDWPWVIPHRGKSDWLKFLDPIEGLYEIPDCWEEWVNLYRKVPYHGVQEAPDVLFAKHRRTIAEALREEVARGPDAAAELCRDLGHDDYYGSYDWTEHQRFQIEAIRLWAAKMRETLQPVSNEETDNAQ